MRCSPYVEWYQNSIAIEGSPAARPPRRGARQPSLRRLRRARSSPATPAGRPSRGPTCSQPAGARYVVLVTKHHDGVLLWPSATPNPHKAAVGERPRPRRRPRHRRAGPRPALRHLLLGRPRLDLRRPARCATSRRCSRPSRRRPSTSPTPTPTGTSSSSATGPTCSGTTSATRPAADLPRAVRALLRGGARRRGQQPLRLDGPDGRHGALRLRHARVLHQGRREPEVGEHPRHRHLLRLQPRGGRVDATSSPDALVRMFVDVVAHGGNLLLNVGPNADGAIPWVQAQRLLALGWWLRTNGDAIYGTRPWTRTDGTTAEGHDVRYTTRDGAVFAIVCGTPASDGRGARRHPAAGRDGPPPRPRRAPRLDEPTDAGCCGDAAGPPRRGARVRPPPVRGGRVASRPSVSPRPARRRTQG